MLSGVQRMLFDDRVTEALAVGGAARRTPTTRDPRRRAHLPARRADQPRPHRRVRGRRRRRVRGGARLPGARAVRRGCTRSRRSPRTGSGRSSAASTTWCTARCALNAVELTDAMTAWGWHNLAMAYSYTGFHGYAIGAIEKARRGRRRDRPAGDRLRGARHPAAATPSRSTSAATPTAASGCCATSCRTARPRRASGELATIRPINRANYGYAAVRLAALGYRRRARRRRPAPVAARRRRSRARRRPARARAGLPRHRRRPADRGGGPAGDRGGVRRDARRRPRCPGCGRWRTWPPATTRRRTRPTGRRTGSPRPTSTGCATCSSTAWPPNSTARTCTSGWPATRTRRNTDPLTGLPNRRYLEHYVADLVGHGGSGRARRLRPRRVQEGQHRARAPERRHRAAAGRRRAQPGDAPWRLRRPLRRRRVRGAAAVDLAGRGARDRTAHRGRRAPARTGTRWCRAPRSA